MRCHKHLPTLQDEVLALRLVQDPPLDQLGNGRLLVEVVEPLGRRQHSHPVAVLVRHNHRGRLRRAGHVTLCHQSLLVALPHFFQPADAQRECGGMAGDPVRIQRQQRELFGLHGVLGDYFLHMYIIIHNDNDQSLYSRGAWGLFFAYVQT